MYAGVFTGVGVEGGGLKYVMKTHSKLHPQTRKDSISYVKQEIKASPFKWCIKTFFFFYRSDLCNMYLSPPPPPPPPVA